MKWIPVDERTPKQGQIVLVIGLYYNGLKDRYYNRMGLAEWDSKDNSYLFNQCFYSEWFTNITHWCEIPEQPKQK